MKKSLIMLTVVLASLALAAAAFAGGKAAVKAAPACGPVPCDVKYVAKTEPLKMKTPTAIPKAGKIKGPGCATIPAPAMTVPVPGTSYAIGEKPEWVKETKTTDVYRDWCKGAAKGKEQLCGPCAPTIAWSCSWQTSEIVGKISYPVYKQGTKKYQFPVDCKVVPKGPASCLW
ncbi:MAG: hypothetical protein V2B18_04810 [Pseudomonadota bacterium]